MVKKIALLRLRELRHEADEMDPASAESAQFRTWQLSVETSIDKLFGPASPYLTNFHNIDWIPGVSWEETTDAEYKAAFLRGLVDAEGILDSAIRAGEDYEFEPADAAASQNSVGAVSDLAALSIGNILKLLRPAQLWAFGAALVVVIAAAFTLGNKLAEYKIDRLENQLETVRSDGAKQAKLAAEESTRERFFTAYVRYAIAKETVQSRNSPLSPEAAQAFENAKNSFASLIMEWVIAQQNPSTPRVEMPTPPTVSKGADLRNAHIEFSDGSIWPVPGEIKALVHRVPQ